MTGTTGPSAGAGPALVAVGQVLRPYGLRGEVRVRPLTDRPRERFAALPECFLVDAAMERRERCRIVSHRFEGDSVLVRMDGIDSPERARARQGWLLAVERAEALPAAAGRFYPWQMEGAAVQTTDGRVVGSFARVEESPGQSLWVVVNGAREWLIPAVPEIVVEVSLSERRIVIDPPEGLLEL